MKKNRYFFNVTLLFVAGAVLFFTYVLSQENKDLEQLNTEIKESKAMNLPIEIDKDVISSSKASGIFTFLRKEESQSISQSNQQLTDTEIDRDVVTTDSNSINQEQIIQDQKEIIRKKQVLNALGEVIQAGYVLTNDNQADFNEYFTQEEKSESVELYHQYVSFSANYLATLKVEVYALEKNRMQAAFQLLAESMNVLDEQKPEKERSRVLQEYLNAANKLNGVIVDLGKEVAAQQIPFTPSEPGYVFVFTL